MPYKPANVNPNCIFVLNRPVWFVTRHKPILKVIKLKWHMFDVHPKIAEKLIFASMFNMLPMALTVFLNMHPVST